MTEPTYGQGARPTTTFISTSSSSCSHPLRIRLLWLDGRAVEGPNGQGAGLTGSDSRVARWHRGGYLRGAARTCAGAGNEAGSVRAMNGRSFRLREAERTAESRRRPTTGNSPDRWPRATRDRVARGLGDYFRSPPGTSRRVNTHRLVPPRRRGSAVRSVDELFSIWKGSVGQRDLPLNVPPKP